VHDGSGRIVVQSLTKQFGAVAAVSNLSFGVEPGTVTGFLGPNGAGKTTTLRAALGLLTPTSGSALINGVPFNQIPDPGRVVGAVLEAQGFHPRRSSRNHLRVYAAAIGVPDSRVDVVLQLVGLGAAGNRMAGGFSLGMRQRLALATALLGDPQILVLDEPANGLDPEGIAWLRTFLKSFAQTGRTVLVSSHGLAEIEQTVDRLVIISRGMTVYNGALDDLRRTQQNKVLVRPSDPEKLIGALREDNIYNVESTQDGWLIIGGVVSEQIADIALRAEVSVYDMRTETPNLEQLYFALTQGQYTPGQYAPAGYVPPGQQPPAGYQQQTGYQPPVGYQPPQTGYQQPGYQQPGYQQQPGYPPQQTGEPVAQLPPQPNPWGPQAQPQPQPEQWAQQPQSEGPQTPKFLPQQHLPEQPAQAQQPVQAQQPIQPPAPLDLPAAPEPPEVTQHVPGPQTSAPQDPTAAPPPEPDQGPDQEQGPNGPGGNA
jgi:ABC-2 type transport system ATP-binding protein